MARAYKQIEVSSVDREVLEARLRAGTTPQRMATRARIVLLSGDGWTVPEIMDERRSADRL